ncbi:hypothetical protein MP228_010174 [Amoeboaphelidium protococcarum]|nr:hypothetical protein MP228_010174 [Amoeboaphelidium protococcarum]
MSDQRTLQRNTANRNIKDDPTLNRQAVLSKRVDYPLQTSQPFNNNHFQTGVGSQLASDTTARNADSLKFGYDTDTMARVLNREDVYSKQQQQSSSREVNGVVSPLQSMQRDNYYYGKSGSTPATTGRILSSKKSGNAYNVQSLQNEPDDIQLPSTTGRIPKQYDQSLDPSLMTKIAATLNRVNLVVQQTSNQAKSVQMGKAQKMQMEQFGSQRQLQAAGLSSMNADQTTRQQQQNTEIGTHIPTKSSHNTHTKYPPSANVQFGVEDMKRTAGQRVHVPMADNLDFPVTVAASSGAVQNVLDGVSAGWEQEEPELQAVASSFELQSVRHQQINSNINGQSVEQQIPSYYNPPSQLVGDKSKTKKPSRQVLSTKEVNILVLYTARIGDLVSLRSLTAPVKVDVNTTDDEGRTPLIFAILGGHQECVQMLIERGALIHQADFTGRTALHWASYHGESQIVHMLLKAGGDPTMIDNQGRSCLHLSMFPSDSDVSLILLKRSSVMENLNQQDDLGLTSAMLAAQNSSFHQLQALISRGANLQLKDKHGKTVLHHCAENKVTHGVKQVLSVAPELLNNKDNYGRTCLHLACLDGNIAIVYYLLTIDQGIINEKDDSDRTLLHCAAISGKPSVLKLLTEFGAKLNKGDKHLATALHYACSQNLVDCVNVLLRKGASTSIKDGEGRQCLIWAAIRGHFDVIRLLCSTDLDVNAAEDHGLTALHFAAYSGHTACCIQLIRRGANVNCTDFKSHPPLFRAAMAGQTETVIALISEGADVLMTDIAGRTALHWSCSSGHIDVVNALLDYMQDINVKDAQGATGLHEAAFHGKSDVLLLLINNGANVDCVDKNGVTALHWASVNGHLNCCRLLLQNGAFINSMVEDQDRDTPLDYAYLNNNYDVAQFLIDQGALLAEEILSRAALIIQKAWRLHKGYKIRHLKHQGLRQHDNDATGTQFQKMLRGAVVQKRIVSQSRKLQSQQSAFQISSTKASKYNDPEMAKQKIATLSRQIVTSPPSSDLDDNTNLQLQQQ